MNLTSKANLGPVASKILTFAVIGLMCHVVPAQSQIISAQYAVAKHESIQTSNHLQVTPAVQRAQASRLETVTSQPIAWYKNKHWWKKHAPIIGGAAGGALIGGLAGGGKGVIIGGAAGAGGGYLYKRLRHHHDYHHQ